MKIYVVVLLHVLGVYVNLYHGIETQERTRSSEVYQFKIPGFPSCYIDSSELLDMDCVRDAPRRMEEWEKTREWEKKWAEFWIQILYFLKCYTFTVLAALFLWYKYFSEAPPSCPVSSPGYQHLNPPSCPVSSPGYQHLNPPSCPVSSPGYQDLNVTLAPNKPVFDPIVPRTETYIYKPTAPLCNLTYEMPVFEPVDPETFVVSAPLSNTYIVFNSFNSSSSSSYPFNPTPLNDDVFVASSQFSNQLYDSGYKSGEDAKNVKRKLSYT